MKYEDFSLNVKICLELTLSKKQALSENREYNGLSIPEIMERLRKRGVKTTEEDVAEKIKWLETSTTVIGKDENRLELSPSALSTYNGLVKRFLE